jgi:hypothetical protein
LAENGVFSNTASFFEKKNGIETMVLKQIFPPKIAENVDHNIDPWCVLNT